MRDAAVFECRCIYGRDHYAGETRCGQERKWIVRATLQAPRHPRSSNDLFRQDLRYAVRRLVASPGFTTVAILSLALGIGANTAIFSIVNAVLLRRSPAEDRERLVEVYTSDDDGIVHATSTYPDFVELRRATDVFEDVLGYQLFLGQVEREDGAGMLVLGELVTGNYFSMFGIRPAIGRAFAPVEDSVPLAHPVVILGHEFWRTAFGADVSVVGSTIRLNRRPYTVIGVAPRDFNGSFSALRADVFAPMMMIGHVMAGSIDRLNTRGSRSMFVRAKLREGVSIERTAAAVSTIGQRLAAEYPETNDDRVGRRYRRSPCGDLDHRGAGKLSTTARHPAQHRCRRRWVRPSVHRRGLGPGGHCFRAGAGNSGHAAGSRSHTPQ